MPGKMARSVPRSPLGLPEVRVAVCTSRQSCRKAGKARRLTRHRQSSGESRATTFILRTNRNRDGGEIAHAIQPKFFLFESGVRLDMAGPQPNWRYCYKCLGMFLGPGATGVCPAGGTHDPSQSPQYTLNDRVGIPGFLEDDWWQCNKCQGLFFGGDWGTGHCPAGGGHDGTGSDEISLDSGTDPSQHQQTGWARCSKCEGLFFYANNFLFFGYLPCRRRTHLLCKRALQCYRFREIWPTSLNDK